MTITRSTDVLSSIVKPEGDHNANRNSKLLKSHQTSTNIRWRKFTQIQRHNHRQLADGETSDESTNEDHSHIDSGALNDGTDEEDDVGEKEIPATREAIGERAVDEGSEHGTECENCYHPSLERGIVGECWELFAL